MRDILVAAIVLGVLPLILRFPYVGILLWSWLGYMNPHRLAYGFAVNAPFAQITAIVTIIALFIHLKKESLKVPWSREVVVLILFIIWMLVSTIDAHYPQFAWPQFNKVIKIQVMIFLTLMLINTRLRIHHVAWIIALSLGFYGIKGGIFTILTGGGYHVRGPLGTFIGGNNEIGLALIMTVPIMRYLQLQAQQRWLQLGLMAAMFFTVVAILGTQSRGALVGLIVMGSYFFMKSRNKIRILLPFLIVVPIALNFMPQTWWERMSTIQTYQEDQSANERLNAWRFAIERALEEPFTGGGYNVFVGGTDAHSIYFEILGEHGFVGLGLFLTLGAATLLTGRSINRLVRGRNDLVWARDLSSMIQVSLIGFASSGAFLGLAYFDLFYHLVALMVMLNTVVLRELKGNDSDGSERGSPDLDRVRTRFRKIQVIKD